jgi:hypothetical protein
VLLEITLKLAVLLDLGLQRVQSDAGFIALGQQLFEPPSCLRA